MQRKEEINWTRQIAAGDSVAVDRFIDAYGSRVTRLVSRFTSSPSDAEDVVQEIFVSLWQSVGKFRGDASLSTFVYRVAFNHCLQHQRRQKTQMAQNAQNTVPLTDTIAETLPSLAPSPAQSAENSELRHQVNAAIECLTEDFRTVVILHELHGLTYAECASVLQIPIGTVKSRLSTAFTRLRPHLEDYK